MRQFTLFTLALLLFSCHTGQKATGPKDDGIIEIVFLQLNDVYEISPLSDGKGGMARVASVRKDLLAKNPNTYTILSGDFISPSVIGTLKYQGKRIRGRQMVDVMNSLGVDWVVFGNHEFDYDDYNDLQARIDESNFTWLGANARFKKDSASAPQRFFKNKNGVAVECPDEQTLVVKDADGTTIRLGLFGVLINTGRKPWVQYTDWNEAAKMSVTKLKAQKSDVVVGLTHLSSSDDQALAKMLPEVPLLMGGHDHENERHVIGNTVLAKADANAKTVYIHTLRYDKKTKKSTVTSELKVIDASVPEETVTAATVNKWEQIKTQALAADGFNADLPVTTLTEPLDCREATIRHKQAPVGTVLNEAMVAAAKSKPDAAFFNSGSIRVDDVLKGTLYEIDIVRMLPFGGGFSETVMLGSLLRQTLEAHLKNGGNGGYLQLWNIAQDAKGNWLVKNKILDDKAEYKIVLPDFLLTGAEQNMGFLKTNITDATTGKTDNPGVRSCIRPDASSKNDLRKDLRKALIAYWRKE